MRGATTASFGHSSVTVLPDYEFTATSSYACFALARSIYFVVCGSRRITSPAFMNWGTRTSTPLSSLAGLRVLSCFTPFYLPGPDDVRMTCFVHAVFPLMNGLHPWR